jgi:hypothetical protein
MTDEATIEYLLSLAEVAGVLVGFGVLIGAIQTREESVSQRMGLIAGVCTIGVVLLFACLFPLLLLSYGLSDIWRYSSLGFLVVNFASFGLAFSRRRGLQLINPVSFDKAIAPFFWIALEIPLQLSLIVNILGLFQHLSIAFYLTAVIIGFIEAGLFLILIVFRRRE